MSIRFDLQIHCFWIHQDLWYMNIEKEILKREQI